MKHIRDKQHRHDAEIPDRIMYLVVAVSCAISLACAAILG
jgi:hypothetical protein